MTFTRPTLSIIILLTIAILVQSETESQRIAIANLLPSLSIIPPRNITGFITFTELPNGTIHVFGTIQGFTPGEYGFHIHELGNTVTCDLTGPHFDPQNRNHGGRKHEVRHVGDFGNVEFEGVPGVPGVATVDFVDAHIKFSGENNILGRSVVLHEQRDDLGEGGHDMSLITGNAGRRIACGVIGIQSGDWNRNAGVSLYSSSLLVTVGMVFFIFK